MSDDGHDLTTHDTFLEKMAKKAHPTPAHAIIKEQPANGITHTPKGLQPTMTIDLHKNGQNTKMASALVITMNSDATKFLNQSNPYDGSGLVPIFDIGRNKGHTVMDDSQFNTGACVPTSEVPDTGLLSESFLLLLQA